ncbi:testis-specific serine/threonine-protein kinase 4 isoform X2 [Anastrepha obliqua]|uniref:testis-specific serine/threonine-protein kinase 4 isoform X2 n=1 Tax=Anastrepha obliqua TaxID=95512 RepID=UPI0024094FBD|nr:testis-specific serine/threonine-protein kinase 4 isoform X2 [Anastrepha obliqua]
MQMPTEESSTNSSASRILANIKLDAVDSNNNSDHIDYKLNINDVLRRRGGASKDGNRSEASVSVRRQGSSLSVGTEAKSYNEPTATVRPKTILEDHGIVLGKVIGTGNYAKVKIGYSEEYGKRVAVKIISKVKAPAEYTQKFLPREIESVKGLHHENLITFYQSIETSHRVYLIMQLAENGTLLDYVRDKKFLEEPQARNIFKQLISAVEYIHSKNVVHRDIKCENLLLDENYTLKLIDFGFARKDTRNSDQEVILSKTFCGSYAYASPEILKGIAYDPFMSDIWACGVVCYAMVFGRLPYDGSNVHVLLKRINASLAFPKNPTVSNECKQLIGSILAPLKVRYTIPQIKEETWFRKS